MFYTRRSIIVLSVVAIATSVVYEVVYAASNNGAGGAGAVAAGALAVALVIGAVAWIGGIALAVRGGSFLWLLVVVLAPLLGPLACALWGPAPAASRRP